MQLGPQGVFGLKCRAKQIHVNQRPFPALHVEKCLIMSLSEEWSPCG